MILQDRHATRMKPVTLSVLPQTPQCGAVLVELIVTVGIITSTALVAIAATTQLAEIGRRFAEREAEIEAVKNSKIIVTRLERLHHAGGLDLPETYAVPAGVDRPASQLRVRCSRTPPNIRQPTVPSSRCVLDAPTRPLLAPDNEVVVWSN